MLQIGMLEPSDHTLGFREGSPAPWARPPGLGPGLGCQWEGHWEDWATPPEPSQRGRWQTAGTWRKSVGTFSGRVFSQGRVDGAAGPPHRRVTGKVVAPQSPLETMQAQRFCRGERILNKRGERTSSRTLGAGKRGGNGPPGTCLLRMAGLQRVWHSSL